MVKNPKSLFVAITLIAFLAGVRTAPAQDVAAALAASDQHFAAIGAGQVAPDDLIKAWTAEEERLSTILAAVKGENPSQVQAKVYRRLGVTKLMLSKGKGSDAADGYFAQAEDVIVKMAAGGPVESPAKQAMLATVWKERADNLVLLGKEDKALLHLQNALQSVRKSDLKGKLGEATIRERLAGVFFRKESWKEALDMIAPAIAIMTPMAEQPGFNREALRMPLWYRAVCTSRLGNDAEGDFGRYIDFVGKDITPHDEADVYREAAVNVGERAPKEAGPARTAALKKAHSYVLKARQIIDRSTKDEDVLEKIAIYSDLAMSYARGGMGAEADTTFKAALAMARKSPTIGPDSPVLIPVLQRYAALLDGLKRPAEAATQREEARRIEDLAKKPKA